MKTRSTSPGMVVLISTVFLLAATIVGVTASPTVAVTRVPICVKENGQIRMLVGNRECDSSERLVEWVVGGEVTDLQLGEGLVGSREDGTVHLAVAPEILEGCSGCRGGRVLAGYRDGPGPIPFMVTGDLVRIAELQLPAGDFVIFAKLTVESEPLFNETSFQRPVFCRLTAGADFDEARTVLEAIHSEDSGSSDGSYAAGVTLQVVHSFTAPGRVVLSAAHAGAFAVAPQVQYRNLKIIAIEAADISNVLLSDN